MNHGDSLSTFWHSYPISLNIFHSKETDWAGSDAIQMPSPTYHILSAPPLSNIGRFDVIFGVYWHFAR